MLTSTSTIRSRLAVCAASVALVAGMLAAPAAAETEHKRWWPNQSATRPGNVEQGGREVNLRYGGHDHGKPPAWLFAPKGKKGKHDKHARHYPPYPPGYGGHDRGHDGRHDNGHGRHRDRDRHDRGHRHYADRGERHYYYSYSYYYPRPYPQVTYYAVPYHTHGPAAGHDHAYDGRQAAMCGGYSDGGRYVLGGSHEPGGTIVGGIVGAAIGSQVGGGNGRLAAVGVGTLIGALIGRDVGRSMDAADRAYAAGSFGHAMEYAPTCSTITWDNPRSGSNGTVTPTQTYEPEPGRYCREFQQQVVIGGKVQDAYGTACRQPDGDWEIVTE